MRCDCYWREQQQLHFKGEPLTPENQCGLAVWTKVKRCLYNVITECQVWQQQRIIAWDKKQNPSQADQLIAQQVHWLATGSLPSTSNPKGKEPKGATGLVEQACSAAQESEKEDLLDFATLMSGLKQKRRGVCWLERGCAGVPTARLPRLPLRMV